MTAIVSVDDMLTRLGQRNIEDITNLLTVAVNAATLQVQAMLDARLDYTTTLERFYVPADQYPRPGQPLALRLNNGFVDPTVTLTVQVADRLLDLGTAAAAPLDASLDFVVDYPKGLVYIEALDRVVADATWVHLNPTLKGAHLSVQYAYGYQKKADAYGMLYQNTPDWLKEAAAMVATEMFKDTMEVDQKRPTNLMGTVAAFLDGYRRYYPTGIRPVL